MDEDWGRGQRPGNREIVQDNLHGKAWDPIILPAPTGWKTMACRNESVYSKADQQLNLGATPCSVLAFGVGLFFNQGRNRNPGN